jgi:putative hydrolase of HD superfamily
MARDIKKLLEFGHRIEKLKLIERYKGQTFWKEYPFPKRYESVADHTWRIALFVLLIEPYLSKKINVAKTLSMALLHDLPEVVVGDASVIGKDGTGNTSHAFNKKLAQKKYLREKAGAKKLFSHLPPELGKKLFDLWMEYEKQTSLEAKVVKALDRIEAKLQIMEYSKGRFFKEHQEFNLKHGQKEMQIDPALFALGELAFKELQDHFVEFKKQKRKKTSR